MTKKIHARVEKIRVSGIVHVYQSDEGEWLTEVSDLEFPEEITRLEAIEAVLERFDQENSTGGW